MTDITLSDSIQNIFNNARNKKPQRLIELTQINTPSPWDLSVIFKLNDYDSLLIRNINKDDVSSLKKFGEKLSPISRELFCPYPWEDPEKLEKSLQHTIDNAMNKVDASYVIEYQKQPIGHFFLWKAGGNPHSLAEGLNIPELGVAMADELQGLGIGSLAVNILQAIAQHLRADAVELTTAMSNDAGWYIYLKAGFQYTGDIKNPLEVDVTDAISGATKTEKFRTERQMVFIINKDKEEVIQNYMTKKRNESEKLK